MKLKLGTRGSDLAMTQSRWVATRLAESGVEAELVVVSTSGDRSSAPTFGAIGPQGVFVREIEEALLDRRVDIAVHSFKDLPTKSPDGLVIGAVPVRRDPADWLLFRAGAADTRTGDGATPGPGAISLPLAAGATVGTSSARRHAWLRACRPDLDIRPLRGNVPTRLKRLADGDYDAILLAAAGIERLNEASDTLDTLLAAVTHLRLDPTAFVPAPAQGALAVQCRADDARIRAALADLEDGPTRTAVELERRTLALAEGGCDSAFGAYAERTAEGFVLRVMAERFGRIVATEVRGDAPGLEGHAMQALGSAA